MILRPVTDGAKAATVLLGRFRWDIGLLGVKNGINTVFTTPSTFVQDSNVVIRVFLNGQRLQIGASEDYTVSESGGIGTGFDTITVSVAPVVTDVLTADYLVL